MSAESREWLSTMTLIGMTEKRGNAWHYREGDNNHFPGAIPAETVRERLFNWSPVESPVVVGGNVSKQHKGITRSDNGDILGIVGKSYQVHGYDQWLIRNVESLLDGDVQIGSAGLLRNGSLAWVQVELSETQSVNGVDFRPHLTAVTSLDKSCATTYRRNVQVVVCDNTLSAAINEGGPVARVTHSSKSLGKLDAIRNTLELIIATGDEFAAELDKLMSEKVTDKRFSKWADAFAGVAGKPKEEQATQAVNKVAELHKLWSTDLRVQPWAGTAYGVLATANTYMHHVQNVRNGSRAERNMERVALGRLAKADASALNLLAAVR